MKSSKLPTIDAAGISRPSLVNHGLTNSSTGVNQGRDRSSTGSKHKAQHGRQRDDEQARDISAPSLSAVMRSDTSSHVITPADMIATNAAAIKAATSERWSKSHDYLSHA